MKSKRNLPETPKSLHGSKSLPGDMYVTIETPIAEGGYVFLDFGVLGWYKRAQPPDCPQANGLWRRIVSATIYHGGHEGMGVMGRV